MKKSGKLPDQSYREETKPLALSSVSGRFVGVAETIECRMSHTLIFYDWLGLRLKKDRSNVKTEYLEIASFAQPIHSPRYIWRAAAS